jgi:hypothetical protein
MFVSRPTTRRRWRPNFLKHHDHHDEPDESPLAFMLPVGVGATGTLVSRGANWCHSQGAAQRYFGTTGIVSLADSSVPGPVWRSIDSDATLRRRGGDRRLGEGAAGTTAPQGLRMPSVSTQECCGCCCF